MTRQEKIKELEYEISAKITDLIFDLGMELEDKEEEIDRLEQELIDKDMKIAQLEELVLQGVK